MSRRKPYSSIYHLKKSLEKVAIIDKKSLEKVVIIDKKSLEKIDLLYI